MLQTFQKTYAGKPVRFFLFPCNQFGQQEPKANSDIKTFASTYIDFTQGNVVLLAKSTTNTPACAVPAAQGCMASSSQCCSSNNDVYAYLIQAEPGALPWNFDKFVRS